MADAATLDYHFRRVTDIENVEELLGEQPCVQQAIDLLKEHIHFSQSGLSGAATEYPSLAARSLPIGPAWPGIEIFPRYGTLLITSRADNGVRFVGALGSTLTLELGGIYYQIHTGHYQSPNKTTNSPLPED